jgi:hypothetical protein
MEFCRLQVDEPNLVEVHSGVAPGTGSAWEPAGTRGRKATERDHALRTQAEIDDVYDTYG